MLAMKVAVVGGSIGGLAAANAFHRLGATVRVFEKSPSGFAGRGGSLGFCDVGLWQSLAGRRMLRRGVQSGRHQGGFFYGDLWQFWMDGLPPGTVVFNTAVESLGDNANQPSINGEAFDAVIVADGGWSRLRGLYFDKRQPEYAGYQLYRAHACRGF